MPEIAASGTPRQPNFDSFMHMAALLAALRHRPLLGLGPVEVRDWEALRDPRGDRVTKCRCRTDRKQAELREAPELMSRWKYPHLHKAAKLLNEAQPPTDNW